jgi:hypothetical protein
VVSQGDSVAVSSDRAWPRAAGLTVVVLVTSIAQPAVLLAIPFLMLAGTRGIRGIGGSVLAALALLVAVSGARDGIWYAERAWALILGAWFVGLTFRVPKWKVSTRALASTFGTLAVVAGFLALRAGAWSSLDWVVRERARVGVETTIKALTVLRGGEALSPAFVAAIYQTASAQLSVFPALTGVASMAALAVVWWVHGRLSRGGGETLGPLKDFRFNDHLVWVFLGGLLLLITRWSEPLTRVGSNAVVFMGALYAMRGAAVTMFMTGGFSLLGYIMVGFALILLPPLVLGVAVVIGIGDTWLNVRARIDEMAA